MQQPLSAACEVNRPPGASSIAPRYAPAAALAIMAGTAGSAPPDALALRCAGVCVNKVVEGEVGAGSQRTRDLRHVHIDVACDA